MDVTRAVDGVVRAQRAVDEARARLDAAVVEARALGATWAQVGDAVGMSRQSAHERWGHIPQAGCQRLDCDCVEHLPDDCGCGHGPGRGRRRRVRGSEPLAMPRSRPE